MMAPEAAVEALASLAQVNRLAVFRLLVQSGKDGLPAGKIAQALKLAPSSLSFHLAHLTRAGLIGQERQSRHIIYRANYEAMNRLIGYLLENCCKGDACLADFETVLRACR